MPQDEIRTVHTFSSAFFEHVDLILGRPRRGGGGSHTPKVFLSLFPRG